ncbi:DUF1804 family protein [Bacteroidales bacterium OttesenSCG-928-C19]|nr:DUF1804 family protein [Bacteroidales bacterium OttesenSCG-928-C19]
MARKKTELREHAKLLFIYENLTQKEIAVRLDVSDQSIVRWKKEDNWETLKASITITREQQLQNLYTQLADLNNSISARELGKRHATTPEADTISKLSNAIAKLENDIGIADIISVSKKTLEFIRKTEPEKAKELSFYFDAFIKDRLS